MVLWVKNSPAMQKTQETWVWSLGREDPLEEEMATHFGTLAWEFPWMEELGRLQSMGSQRGRYDWASSLVYRRANIHPSEMVIKNCRGRKTPSHILWGHIYLDTTIRQTYTKKKITGQRHWWTQTQNTSNLNPMIHYKDHDQDRFIPGTQ